MTNEEVAKERVICEKCGRDFSRLGISSHTRRCGKPIDRISCPEGCGRDIARHRIGAHLKVCRGAVSAGKCGTCGKRIPAGKKFCGRSCSARGNAVARRDAAKVTCPLCGNIYSARGISMHLTSCRGEGTDEDGTVPVPVEVRHTPVSKAHPVTPESLHSRASARRKAEMSSSVAAARAESIARWREKRAGSK